jgi:hypothetical protein
MLFTNRGGYSYRLLTRPLSLVQVANGRDASRSRVWSAAILAWIKHPPAVGIPTEAEDIHGDDVLQAEHGPAEHGAVAPRAVVGNVQMVSSGLDGKLGTWLRGHKVLKLRVWSHKLSLGCARLRHKSCKQSGAVCVRGCVRVRMSVDVWVW